MGWDPKVRQPEDEAHTRSNSQLCISCVDQESFRGYLRLRSGFPRFARQPPMPLCDCRHCTSARLTKGNSINPIGDFNTY